VQSPYTGWLGESRGSDDVAKVDAFPMLFKRFKRLSTKPGIDVRIGIARPKRRSPHRSRGAADEP
jgi:hypothetical protein